MPRTIQCSQCGSVLNLPPQSEGRRLKCPKCGARFQVGGGSGEPRPAPAGPADPDSGSTLILSKKFSTPDLPVMPTTTGGDLRETFELPLMTEADTASGPNAQGAHRPASDAAALFQDAPAAPRRKTGAEARARTRRCPTCGGVVPAGMSICQTCGLDLETGLRVGLQDDLSPPPPARPQGIPVMIAVVGGLSLALSVALASVATARWYMGVPGAGYFIPVALFGAYAAGQFLRGKTAKLLIVALTLGAAIDLVGLVALPIYNAQAATDVVARPDSVDDPDAAPEVIRSVADQLDVRTLTTGIVLLVVYALVSIYLLSPSVARHFRK